MKMSLMTLTALVIACLVAPPAVAQGDEGQGTDTVEEPSFHETVLQDLAAWRHTEAKESMKANKKTHGKSTGFEIGWAVMLAEERKLDKAVRLLKKITDKNPTDASAPYFLGEIYSWRKEAEPADEAWKKARDRAKTLLTEDPQNGWASYWLGAAFIRLGEYSKAVGKIRKGLKNGTNRSMSEYQLGLALMYQEKWESARNAFDQCLEADSGFSHAYYYRGRVWQKLGKTEEMLLDMDRFLALAPDAREANAAKSILRAGR